MLRIMDKVAVYNKPNCYQVEIYSNVGEASTYKTVSKHFNKDKDEKYLEELLEVLKVLKENLTFNNNRITNYNKFFHPTKFKDDQEKLEYKPFSNIELGYNYNTCGLGSVESFNVYYYDENLVKYNVEFD